MPRVIVYEADDGVSPFSDWFDQLSAKAAAKVRVATERMVLGNFGDHKSVGAGVMERRIHWGPGLRVYFGRDGDDLVMLLAGGTKKRQSRDVATAKSLWEEYRLRRRAGETVVPAAPPHEAEPADADQVPNPDEE